MAKTKLYFGKSCNANGRANKEKIGSVVVSVPQKTVRFKSRHNI